MSEAFAHGGPVARAILRREPGDFRVDEELGFAPTGSGEHAFLEIEKTGANTAWVARELARAAGVAPLAVGFAGLKDRHAVTRQAFTVHLGPRTEPDWAAIAPAGVRVLASTRHARKLKRGAHRGNRFVIRVRDVDGDRAAVDARLAVIAARGVPNYFGEQRFGRGGDNLDLARALFAGARLAREQRGFALSAARAHLFNAMLATRVARGDWERGLDGDVFMLDGRHSIFGPESVDDALAARIASGDVHPTGALWGQGDLRSTGDVAALERGHAQAYPELAAGLERAGLAQERRALRLRPRALTAHWEDDATLVVAFGLDAGAFATTVLREAVAWTPTVAP